MTIATPLFSHRCEKIQELKGTRNIDLPEIWGYKSVKIFIAYSGFFVYIIRLKGKVNFADKEKVNFADDDKRRRIKY